MKPTFCCNCCSKLPIFEVAFLSAACTPAKSDSFSFLTFAISRLALQQGGQEQYPAIHRTKLYYHGFFKYGATSKSHPCKADVLDVQLKQSHFMISAEKSYAILYLNGLNVCGNRTSAGQTYYDGLSWASMWNVYKFTDLGSFWFSIQEASRNNIDFELSSWTWHTEFTCISHLFNFYCKFRLIWGLLIKRPGVFQLNHLARSDTDMRL